MSKKSQAAYSHVFSFIESNIFKISKAVSCTTDFEVAMRNAVSAMNPKIKMFTCHFHFCQAAKRRASQTPGFVQFIRSNKDAESIYYRLQCLPILPAQYINDAFDSLKEEAFNLNKAAFMKYFAYFEHQWIKKVNILTYFDLVQFYMHFSSQSNMITFHFDILGGCI